MSNNKEFKILGCRIKEARISRGYTINELADKIGVSKQQLSLYENDKTKLNNANLIKISEELNFPISFFLKEKSPESNIEYVNKVFFRSKTKTPKKTKDCLIQHIKFIEDIIYYLSNFIQFPKFNIPKEFNSDYKIGVSDHYLENKAEQLRKYWKLGNYPIKNMTTLLEKNGIFITNFELNTTEVDAFSYISKTGNPIIVSGSDKSSNSRLRYNLCHELFHLIFHQNLTQEEINKYHKILEDEANRFASIFLMPANSFSDDIYSITLDSFIPLKKKWNVSIASIIMRLFQLDIITADQKTYLFKRLSYKKWRIKEPLDDLIPLEKPSLFKQAIDLLKNHNIINTKELIDSLCLNVDDIENLCSLDKNYLKKDYKDTYLKLIK